MTEVSGHATLRISAELKYVIKAVARANGLSVAEHLAKLHEEDMTIAKNQGVKNEEIDRVRLTHKWELMRSRCLNVDDPQYQQYGGRGVKICSRWDDVNKYIEDMGETVLRSEPHRRNHNAHYTPDNVEWKTDKHKLGTVGVRGVEYHYRGQVYRTRQQLLLNVGISKTAVNNLMKGKYAQPRVRCFKLQAPGERATWSIDGVEYTSLREASGLLGKPLSTVKRWVYGEAKPPRKDCYVQFLYEPSEVVPFEDPEILSDEEEHMLVANKALIPILPKGWHKTYSAAEKKAYQERVAVLLKDNGIDTAEWC